MPRPPRIEFAGALHHVWARGNGGTVIAVDDYDYVALEACLARAVVRMRWRCYAYCLVPNAFHLLVETVEPNLGRGMQQLCGGYAQGFNQRHRRRGHLFAGRYRAKLVSREAHLGEVARAVELYPVRAGICADPADWRWSSYRATAGLEPALEFVAVDAVLELSGAV